MSSALSETERHIPLPPTNDIRTCSQLKDLLADCLKQPCALSVDAGAFETGDITVVQILISAAKTAERLGGSMTIANPSPAFTALLERCGCDADTVRLRSREQ